MRKWGCAIAGLMVGAMPIAAEAQEQPAAAPPAAEAQGGATAEAPADDEFAGEIVVTGQLRGAVEGDIPPEVQLSSADIRAYGASTVEELLSALGPLTGSARGREGGQPVILLNGRRISSFREIRQLPTEAIERVDILPEEVALKYGYRADQRVVNFVLRERFRAITVQLEGGMPTEGGTAEGEFDIDLLRINRDRRINLDFEINGRSGLLESERGVIPTGGAGLFDPRGNVSGLGGGEIDPALSALAGALVTTAGVPAGAATGAPGLTSFVPTANQPYAADATRFQTLRSPSREVKLEGTYAQNISESTAGSVNLSLEAQRSRPLLGLAGVALVVPEDNGFSPFGRDVQLYRAFDQLEPLARVDRTVNAQAGFSLNGTRFPLIEEWRWSLIGNYARVTTRSTTETGVDAAPLQALLDADDPGFNPFAPISADLLGLRTPDEARSTSSVGSISGLVNGPLFALPAGDVSTSIRVEGRTSDFSSRSTRAGVLRTGENSRDSGSVRANLDLPIASRRRDVLGAIGDLSLNGNVEVETLSDFGTLVTTGYGFNWSPVNGVRFLVSVTDEEGAPSANQLGDPTIATPNVRVYDFVRGETVAVTQITGGNPALEADERHVFKLGLNVRPLADTDLDFRADYVSSSTRNRIGRLPGVTAEVEAAFPARFVRDPTGRLISIDNRFVNFLEGETAQLTWGFNLSLPIKSSMQRRIEERRAQREAARAEAERNGTPLPAEEPRRRRGEGGEQGAGEGQAAPAPDGQQASPPQGDARPQRPGGGRFGGPGGGGRGFGGGRFGGPNGAGAGRLQFNLFHTWTFKDREQIAEGLPVLDYLNGSAKGEGGTPAHRLEGRAAFSKDGFQASLAGNWQSGTRIATGVLGSGDELNFGSLATFGLSLRADLGQQFRQERWLRGSSVRLRVSNLFDARRRVTDEAGEVPLSYQRALDLSGRAVTLEFRKLFR